jgi:hypothetical protein
MPKPPDPNRDTKPGYSKPQNAKKKLTWLTGIVLFVMLVFVVTFILEKKIII